VHIGIFFLTINCRSSGDLFFCVETIFWTSIKTCDEDPVVGLDVMAHFVLKGKYEPGKSNSYGEGC